MKSTKRDIRFRAWDKRGKRMGQVLLLEYHTDFPGIIERVDLWPYSIPIDTYAGKDAHHLILMQYTGFTDGTKWEQLSYEEKHDWENLVNGTEKTWRGKEIYENDLIRNQSGDIFRVEWSVGQYWAVPEQAGETAIPLEEPFPLTPDTFAQEHFKVIGNIYEHTPLLDEKP